MPLDVSVCSKLCGVTEQISAGVPARDPDRWIKWFIGFVVIGVVVNLLSGLVVEQKWAWLPSAVFVAALLVAVLSSGLLRRERYRTTQARAMALLALAGYLAVTVWGTVTGWPLAVMILSLAYLWEAGAMLLVNAAKSRGPRACRLGDSLFACGFGVLAVQCREPAGSMDVGHGRGFGG